MKTCHHPTQSLAAPWVDACGLCCSVKNETNDLFAVKGYLRKGNILLALKESTKGADAFQKALDIDSSCQVMSNLYCTSYTSFIGVVHLMKKDRQVLSVRYALVSCKQLGAQQECICTQVTELTGV